jgi:hypothetical protein
MNITLKQVVKELKVHQQLDHYIQRHYALNKGKDFRGCSIGCAVESLLRLEGKPLITGNVPEELERIGVPQTMSRMIEFVFEKLPHAKAVQYSIDCHEAMIGKTKLDDVMRQQHIWMLELLDSPHCERVLYLLKNNGTQQEFIDVELLAEGSATNTALAARMVAEVALRLSKKALAACETRYAAWAAWAACKEKGDKNFVTAYADNLLKLIKEAD